MLMKFFSLLERSLFSIHDPTGVKLLKKVRLKFCHLNKHKFRHNFKDTVVTMCNCGTETAKAEHFFLCCPFFVTKRQKSGIFPDKIKIAKVFPIYKSGKNVYYQITDRYLFFRVFQKYLKE